jgi:hypothetical protein
MISLKISGTNIIMAKEYVCWLHYITFHLNLYFIIYEFTNNYYFMISPNIYEKNIIIAKEYVC